MSTPRTNERTIEFRGRSGEWVNSGFARGLERENTKLRKDKERLDWLLENDCLRDWIDHGVAYGLNEGRKYIDEAMKEEAQHEDR